MDTASYRLAERSGARDINSVRQSMLHHPVAFAEYGFPVRVECHEDLRAYLDVMHESRFDAMMTEMDGLQDDELDELVDGLVRYCQFCLATFGTREIVLPLSGMIMQYAAAKKLKGIPERARVLEIGSGSGLISFFVSQDKAIEQYHQIECAEAFYLLQTHINRYVYGHGFLDHAHASVGAPKTAGIGLEELSAIRPDILGAGVYEKEIRIEYTARPRVEQFPWWRLERVLENQYDVVMSNANLTEFSPEAMRYYSALIAKVLKPTGVFFAQCTGGGSNPIQTALKDLMAARIVPFMFGGYIDQPASPTRAASRKSLAVQNVMMMPIANPLLATVAPHNGGLPLVHTQDAMTRAVFGLDRPAGVKRTREEVTERVKDRLHARAGRPAASLAAE